MSLSHIFIGERMDRIKTMIVSHVILFLARLVDRQPQPGCHVIRTVDTVMLITPDGFSTALVPRAAEELSRNLSLAANNVFHPSKDLS
jgi:hypothetical protein